MSAGPICAVAGCEKPPRAPLAGGPCEMHYYRMRRTGSYVRTRPWHRRGVCRVAGCGNSERARGLCAAHAARVSRQGTTAYIAHADRALPRGERHHAWVGDAATYSGAHQRVRTARGSARKHPCVDCGSPAHQWSYNHSAPDERESAEGLPYSPDPSQYDPRCTSCHKTFDLGRLMEPADLA